MMILVDLFLYSWIWLMELIFATLATQSTMYSRLPKGHKSLWKGLGPHTLTVLFAEIHFLDWLQ